MTLFYVPSNKDDGQATTINAEATRRWDLQLIYPNVSSDRFWIHCDVNEVKKYLEGSRKWTIKISSVVVDDAISFPFLPWFKMDSAERRRSPSMKGRAVASRIPNGSDGK